MARAPECPDSYQDSARKVFASEGKYDAHARSPGDDLSRLRTEEVARRANLDGRSISDYIARLVVAHIAPPKGKRNGKGKS